jgi:CheY-like chemotaxis protein
VLLVEDEPVNAAVAEGYLAALGCTSVWVESGTEAVARTAAERFDLILMDLNMPGLDGFATSALIRQQQGRAADGDGKRRIPIVALTAHDAAHYREKCIAAGLDDILSKPYTLDHCARLLRRWLISREPAPRVRAGFAKTAADAGVDPASLASVDASAVAALRELRTSGHADLYSKLVELFRASSTQSLAQLSDALARDDLTAAAAECHKLASAAANIGALAFGRETKELERHCLADERARAHESYQALLAAHAPLLETLDGQRLRATA